MTTRRKKKAKAPPRPFVFQVPKDDPILADMDQAQQQPPPPLLPTDVLVAAEAELRNERRATRRAKAIRARDEELRKKKKKQQQPQQGEGGDSPAERVGPFRIVRVRGSSSSEDDLLQQQQQQQRKTSAVRFLEQRLYGDHVPRLPAHLALRSHAAALSAVGKVRAQRRRVQAVHDAIISSRKSQQQPSRPELRRRPPPRPF